MRVYILGADGDTFRPIYLAMEDGGLEFTRRFNGTPLKNPLTGNEPFRFVPRILAKGDTPAYDPTIPVFNRRAVNTLADLLEPNGQLFSFMCQDEEYFLFNTTRLVDALDEDNCDLERFDDGRIMDIDRYAFFMEKLRGETLFKLRQDPLGSVYVIDPFVQRVLETGLRGFRFPLVWSG